MKPSDVKFKMTVLNAYAEHFLSSRKIQNISNRARGPKWLKNFKKALDCIPDQSEKYDGLLVHRQMAENLFLLYIIYQSFDENKTTKDEQSTRLKNLKLGIPATKFKTLQTEKAKRGDPRDSPYKLAVEMTGHIFGCSGKTLLNRLSKGDYLHKEGDLNMAFQTLHEKRNK